MSRRPASRAQTVVSAPELSVSVEDILASGCAELTIAINDQQRTLLLEYLDLLERWNHAYNLTAVRDREHMVTRHLLDSLAVAPHLHGQTFIDVGTGAGLPGVPLAVLFPNREIHLLDSNGKKTRFLFQVKTALRLDNMTVHHARVESFNNGPGYDAVLSRAFSSLADMATGSRHLLLPEGRLLAMKGGYPQDELDAVRPLCEVITVHRLLVPGLAEQRHLVEMRPRPQ